MGSMGTSAEARPAGTRYETAAAQFGPLTYRVVAVTAHEMADYEERGQLGPGDLRADGVPDSRSVALPPATASAGRGHGSEARALCYLSATAVIHRTLIVVCGMETNHRELIQKGGRIMLQARLRRSLPRLAATVALAVPAFVFATGSAQAETVPGCSSAFQIGSTATITEAGQTFASVKQFYGCGENWGYIYIWQGWRNTHSSWGMCTAIMDSTTHDEDGLTCGGSQNGQIELWSGGTSTANDCTQAMGVDTDSEAYNYSSQVC